jgi:hypothetical protein
MQRAEHAAGRLCLDPETTCARQDMPRGEAHAPVGKPMDRRTGNRLTVGVKELRAPRGPRPEVP